LGVLPWASTRILGIGSMCYIDGQALDVLYGLSITILRTAAIAGE
jgi:hypothetical protein